MKKDEDFFISSRQAAAAAAAAAATANREEEGISYDKKTRCFAAPRRAFKMRGWQEGHLRPARSIFGFGSVV